MGNGSMYMSISDYFWMILGDECESEQIQELIKTLEENFAAKPDRSDDHVPQASE